MVNPPMQYPKFKSPSNCGGWSWGQPWRESELRCRNAGRRKSCITAPTISVSLAAAAGEKFEDFKLLNTPDAISQCCLLLEDDLNPLPNFLIIRVSKIAKIANAMSRIVTYYSHMIVICLIIDFHCFRFPVPVRQNPDTQIVLTRSWPTAGENFEVF